VPLAIDLSDRTDSKNRNEALSITTSPDTITITVNANYPRVVAFRPTVDCTLFARSSGNAAFPIASGAALQLEIAQTTVFTAAAASASGLLHAFVLR
jgi:hypothetical protein